MLEAGSSKTKQIVNFQIGKSVMVQLTSLMFLRLPPAKDCHWQQPKLVNSCSCAKIRDHENEIDESNTLVSSIVPD